MEGKTVREFVQGIQDEKLKKYLEWRYVEPKSYEESDTTGIEKANYLTERAEGKRTDLHRTCWICSDGGYKPELNWGTKR